MSTDEQYQEALGYYTRGRDEGHPLDPDFLHEEGDEYRADFDHFLARVRREAAREALNKLIAHAELLADRAGEHYTARCIWQTVAGFAEGNRDTHYPEESP